MEWFVLLDVKWSRVNLVLETPLLQMMCPIVLKLADFLPPWMLSCVPITAPARLRVLVHHRSGSPKLTFSSGDG